MSVKILSRLIVLGMATIMGITAIYIAFQVIKQNPVVLILILLVVVAGIWAAFRTKVHM